MKLKARFSTKSLTLPERVPGVRSFILASLLVLLAGVLISVLFWHNEKQQVLANNKKRFTEQVDVVNDAVTSRLSIYEEILRGGAGLFSASESVTRNEWRAFVAQYDIEKRYPGLLALGYAPHITEAQRDALIQAVRTDGYEDFKILPSGDRSNYTPVVYIEPFSDQNKRAFGYDMYSDTVRREAMDRARNNADVAISGKVVLVQDADNKKPGFLMYLPIYSNTTSFSNGLGAERKLEGYVYSAFRAGDFFSLTLKPTRQLYDLGVQVYSDRDITPESLMYESRDFATSSTVPSAPFHTVVAGQEWTYIFKDVRSNNPGFTADDIKPSLILIGGVLTSLSLAIFLFLIMHIRARALVFAKQKETQQAKDDLLALASHQLRTPATVVKQYLGMVLQGYLGKVNAKQLPSLQRAYINNERQIEIINQILYVAKADAGRLNVYKSRINLNSIIEEVIADLTDELDDKDQAIIFDKKMRSGYINSDEHCVRMIMENLITNASKYSDTGTKIIIKTSISRGFAKISVTDHGVGIDRKDFDKLFVKFSRIDNVFSVQEGGSGIGLYLDKVLVDLLGGRIEVESTPGKGSTFIVYLPAK